jgi:ATP-dependent DNA helicase RecQ
VARFGAGEVVMSTDEQVAILFPDGNVRTFVANRVQRVRQASAHSGDAASADVSAGV